MVGGIAAYLGIFTYAMSYLFFRTYYDRVLPGMNISYPYMGVLEAVWQKPIALAAILLPALVILSRYARSDSRPIRPAARRASHAASIAMTAYWHLGGKAQTPEVVDLRKSLRARAISILEKMPDGYWALGTLLQLTPVRTIWAVLGLSATVALASAAIIRFIGAPIVALILEWWPELNRPPAYWVVSVAIFAGIAWGAALVASAFHAAQLAIESHYWKHPGRLLRRRVVLAAFGVLTMMLLVTQLAMSYAALHNRFAENRFPRVSVVLQDPLKAANGARLAPDDVRDSVTDSETASGYLVDVPTSDDVFLRLASDPRSTAMSSGPPCPVCVRISSDQIRAITRGSGPYDTGP